MKKLVAFLLVLTFAVPCLAAPVEMPDYLVSAQNDGVIFGDEKGDLHENEPATRAEFLALTVRFLGLTGGENVFSDVSENDWFAKSMAAAYFSGIFAGFPDGTARPYEQVKTEDAIAILGRYYNATEHKGQYSGISGYAADYFGYAFENGIFSAWRHLPAPKRSITKGEVISLLYRYREENSENVCFSDGYPKISDIQSFGKISADIKTVENCAIYYALREKDDKSYDWTEFSANGRGGTTETIRISADTGKVYDLYIKAVSVSSGRTQIKEFENVVPSIFLRGYGTQSSPYVIYTEKQLAGISGFPDKSYVLGSNIKLSERWTPIKSFSGTLNGAGYRITGLSVEENGTDGGLFAEIAGGRVKNLTVDGDVKAKSTAGIIAGQNNGTIENCCVTGYIEVVNNNAGGICGVNKGEVTRCLSCLYSVNAGSFAGGISGQNNGKITECLSAAETVTSQMYAGGISGQNNGGSIENCVAANIAVYNTMTYNGGKISTNRNEGKMKNNFSLAEMVSNAAETEESADSRNGLAVPWDSLLNTEFYYSTGWDRKSWKSAENGFLMPYPKNAAEPLLESGLTPYFPKKISTAYELSAIAANCKGHYVLANDIKLDLPWKTIDTKDGFSGTLDGKGHTISGLTLKGENGFFSNITGGTVKNLRFSDVSVSQSFDGGIIAACNYGYIENCSVSGRIDVQKAKKIGVVTGENNGRIADCSASFTVDCGTDAQIGGICAVNNAVIEGCAFSGKITQYCKNSEIGGICAADNEGYISESAADITVSVKAESAYVGGICAVSQDSQIYKCAAMGNCSQSGAESVSGGICAVAEGTSVYNCFSELSFSSDAEAAISGGICAVAEGANIQNTYSAGSVKLSGEEAVAGGICAVAEASYITQNVALNPELAAKKSAGAIAAEYSSCDISDNYSCQRIRINLRQIEESERNGIVKTAGELQNTEFYLKPLSQDGLIGWDEPAWTASGTDYSLPILTDTPLMDRAKTPVFK